MSGVFYLKRFSAVKKAVTSFVACNFIFSLVIPAGYSQEIFMPAPGTMVGLSPVFEAPVLKGLNIHSENPFLLDFIVNTGHEKVKGEKLKVESEKLVKYFLSALTIPDKEAWVNLSPYEANRIIPDALSKTEMGKVMLEQDYVLKQLSASLTNPETELGKKYWDEVERRTTNHEQRTTNNGRPTFDVPRSTFTKVWIIPGSAEVAEKDGKVYITGSRLKVMMEQDYVAEQRSRSPERVVSEAERRVEPRVEGEDYAALEADNGLRITDNEKTKEFSSRNPQSDIRNPSSEVFRQLILPKLEEEVNAGKNFAQVRQIYNAAILAVWYKNALKESLLGKIYVDQQKVAGVEIDNKSFKEKVYSQYLEAFKKGVYNIVKEDFDLSKDETTPRKYFSGGLTPMPSIDQIGRRRGVLPRQVDGETGSTAVVKVALGEKKNGDVAAIMAGAARVAEGALDLRSLPAETQAWINVRIATLDASRTADQAPVTLDEATNGLTNREVEDIRLAAGYAFDNEASRSLNKTFDQVFHELLVERIEKGTRAAASPSTRSARSGQQPSAASAVTARELSARLVMAIIDVQDNIEKNAPSGKLPFNVVFEVPEGQNTISPRGYSFDSNPPDVRNDIITTLTSSLGGIDGFNYEVTLQGSVQGNPALKNEVKIRITAASPSTRSARSGQQPSAASAVTEDILNEVASVLESLSSLPADLDLAGQGYAADFKEQRAGQNLWAEDKLVEFLRPKIAELQKVINESADKKTPSEIVEQMTRAANALRSIVTRVLLPVSVDGILLNNSQITEAVRVGKIGPGDGVTLRINPGSAVSAYDVSGNIREIREPAGLAAVNENTMIVLADGKEYSFKWIINGLKTMSFEGRIARLSTEGQDLVANARAVGGVDIERFVTYIEESEEFVRALRAAGADEKFAQEAADGEVGSSQVVSDQGLVREVRAAAQAKGADPQRIEEFLNGLEDTDLQLALFWMSEQGTTFEGTVSIVRKARFARLITEDPAMQSQINALKGEEFIVFAAIAKGGVDLPTALKIMREHLGQGHDLRDLLVVNNVPSAEITGILNEIQGASSGVTDRRIDIAGDELFEVLMKQEGVFTRKFPEGSRDRDRAKAVFRYLFWLAYQTGNNLSIQKDHIGNITRGVNYYSNDHTGLNDVQTEAFLKVLGYLESNRTQGYVPSPKLQETLGRAISDLTSNSMVAGSNVMGSQKDKYGGINFDPSLMDLQIKRDKNGVPLPLPQQNIQNINIEGLFPVIINIQPASLANFPLLSKAEEEQERISSQKSAPASKDLKAIREDELGEASLISKS